MVDAWATCVHDALDTYELMSRQREPPMFLFVHNADFVTILRDGCKNGAAAMHPELLSRAMRVVVTPPFVTSADNDDELNLLRSVSVRMALLELVDDNVLRLAFSANGRWHVDMLEAWSSVIAVTARQMLNVRHFGQLAAMWTKLLTSACFRCESVGLKHVAIAIKNSICSVQRDGTERLVTALAPHVVPLFIAFEAQSLSRDLLQRTLAIHPSACVVTALRKMAIAIDMLWETNDASMRLLGARLMPVGAMTKRVKKKNK